MAVLKYYDGDSWEPVVSALQGPTGAAGAIYQEDAPTDTGVLWVDTDDDGFLVVPNGGATGSVLTKQSSADYDTGWDTPTPSGLVHINTTSFSAVSAVSLPDNTFTSTYDRYMINFLVDCSTTLALNYRVRAAGTDASGSNYNNYANFVSTIFNGGGNISGQTSGRVVGNLDTFINGLMKVDYIASARNTIFFMEGNGIERFWFQSGGNHAVATAYDSLSFIASTGTITGSVSVYGMRK